MEKFREFGDEAPRLLDCDADSLKKDLKPPVDTGVRSWPSSRPSIAVGGQALHVLLRARQQNETDR